MEVRFTCNYCDHKWMYARSQVDLVCPLCHSKSIKIREVKASDKIDYYKGSPPFPDDAPDNGRDDWGLL